MPEFSLPDFSTPRTLTLFLLVDTSGSMHLHQNIVSVCSAVEQMVPPLKAFSDRNPDIEIQVPVLSFSNDCVWLTHDADGLPAPVALNDFRWSGLSAEGLTSMGAAFLELNRRLARTSFLSGPGIPCRPVIILLSDGIPTDDWQQGLNQLRQNRWFQHAIRLAVSVDNADPDIRAAFTGSPEYVMNIDSGNESLSRLFSRLAVISSVRTAQSHMALSASASEESRWSDPAQMIRDARTGPGSDSVEASDWDKLF